MACVPLNGTEDPIKVGNQILVAFSCGCIGHVFLLNPYEITLPKFEPIKRVLFAHVNAATVLKNW